MKYEIIFPTPSITTWEEFEAHTDELAELRKKLFEEMTRSEMIRRELNIVKDR